MPKPKKEKKPKEPKKEELVDTAKAEPSEFIVVDVVEGAEPEEEPKSDETLVSSFLERLTKTPPTPTSALTALQEEAELRTIEEATKKMEKASKRRTFKPVTLKIVGDMLVHWYSMKDGMRSSLLDRPGVTAAEKAVYSKLPINDDTALDYLLTLHEEEMERRDDTKRAMMVETPHRPEPTEDDELIKRLSSINQRRQQTSSSNPHSLINANPPPTLPKMGALFKDEGFTLGGAPVSEAEFFRMAASKKPEKRVKK